MRSCEPADSGVYNLSAPVLGSDNTALAALTCPYIAPLNRPKAPDIPRTIAMLQETAAALSLRVRGQVDAEPRLRVHDFYLNDIFTCDYFSSEETSRPTGRNANADRRHASPPHLP